MAELEIHFMGLLMPRVGMRTGATFRVTAQAAFLSGSSTKHALLNRLSAPFPENLAICDGILFNPTKVDCRAFRPGFEEDQREGKEAGLAAVVA
ncbi:hypothetical protein [Pseudomonas lundensis]|uniref:hypothetical protein n=3 Tax=Pseudomonas lundensis TaxID=86185 RepID=UPI00117AA21A|nr:hypothetical protein [Pseudomonas lundensis]